MAKREPVHVPADLTGAPSGAEHFDGPAVFAAEIIEIGNVVVGLVAQTWQIVADAKVARFLVAVQRAREIVQVDKAHGHVVQRDGNVLPISEGGERFTGALIVGERLFKTILAMKDVSNVVVQAGQAALFSKLREDLPGAFGGCESAVVLSEKDERLDGIAQRTRRLLPDFQSFIDFERLVVMFDRANVI